MTYARRVEATHTKTEDTPRHEKRRQYRQRPKENEPPACVDIRPPAASISTTEQTNRKPQPHENRRPLVESSPPAAVLLACVVLSTFAALHCKPRPVSCSRRQTPQSLNKTRHAPAYAVQTRPPCGDDTERAGDITPARANVDNTDTQTKAPPYGSAPRGGIRYAAPRGDHTPRP